MTDSIEITELVRLAHLADADGALGQDIRNYVNAMAPRLILSLVGLLNEAHLPRELSEIPARRGCTCGQRIWPCPKWPYSATILIEG